MCVCVCVCVYAFACSFVCLLVSICIDVSVCVCVCVYTNLAIFCSVCRGTGVGSLEWSPLTPGSVGLMKVGWHMECW